MGTNTPQVVVTSIDFSQTSLTGTYDPFYAKVIDNLFSADDCARLLELASANDGWRPATMSASDTEQTIHTSFRNNDNVVVINDQYAAWIYEKLRPYVEEIYEIPPEGRWGCITSRNKKQGPTWSLTGINPRLSFLRYGPGHYFKPHCDGLNDVGATKSFVTLHLYLNDSALASESTPFTVDTDAPLPTKLSSSLPSTPLLSATVPLPESESNLSGADTHLVSEEQRSSAAGAGDVPLHGGSTRFWTPNKKAFIDVHPRLGRVLVFQQRMLVHSGEQVTQGIKYTMRSDFMFKDKAQTQF